MYRDYSPRRILEQPMDLLQLSEPLGDFLKQQVTVRLTCEPPGEGRPCLAKVHVLVDYTAERWNRSATARVQYRESVVLVRSILAYSYGAHGRRIRNNAKACLAAAMPVP